MHRPLDRRVVHALAACTLLIITIGCPARCSVAGEDGEALTPAALTRAVNQLVPTDIPITAAASMPCAMEQLPRSLAKLLPLLPSVHRDLIGECARGRTRLDRAISTFDLLAALEDPVNRPAAVTRVRSFFDGRPVDVAAGAGLSDGPYPISFDWVVVLDPRSRTLFSFVLNCHD